jgi:hypothetical protein
VKIEAGQSYLVTEFDEGIVITHAGVTVKMPGAQPMVLVDRQHLPEYVGTYLSLREAGKSKREAHETAMKARSIQKVIKVG